MAGNDDVELEKIRKFYDEDYYRDSRDHDALPAHYRTIARRVGSLSGVSVLDIACGTGKWLELLASRGAKVSGIDLSERAIEACIRRLPKGHFDVGNAEALPYEPNSFGLITCLGSLEHFIDPRAALREMLRVGTRDVRILLLVPNETFFLARLGLYGGTHQARIREIARTLDGWSELFDSAGLTVCSRWRDLHLLSIEWIFRNGMLSALPRACVAMMLPLLPMGAQYQVYHFCRRAGD